NPRKTRHCAAGYSWPDNTPTDLWIWSAVQAPLCGLGARAKPPPPPAPPAPPWSAKPEPCPDYVSLPQRALATPEGRPHSLLFTPCRNRRNRLQALDVTDLQLCTQAGRRNALVGDPGPDSRKPSGRHRFCSLRRSDSRVVSPRRRDATLVTRIFPRPASE